MRRFQLKKRRGVNILVATLMLVAITIAAAVLTNSWVMSVVGSQSTQARTQIRIDTVAWGPSDSPSITLDIRNTGSIDAILVSVSIKKNSAGSTSLVIPLSTTICAGSCVGVPATGTLSLAALSPAYALNTSYLIRVTTNNGFYNEAVFTSPSS